MGTPGWLSQHLTDVPAGERWLGSGERRVLAGLRLERRRADWRLGRWTAKAAVGAWLDVAPERVEVLAAADGAPEAWVDGEPAPVSISLTHRGGRALATVTQVPDVIGCDLEVVESRSGAFIREWLAPDEQAQVAAADPSQRPRLVNLMWTGKEAAAKVRREGLRLDVRRAVVSGCGFDIADGRWRALRVQWQDGGAVTGWWRAESAWVMSVAGEPPPERPRALERDGKG